MLEANKKITQSELLEKIVEKAIEDDDFMDTLFSNTPRVIVPEKKELNITITNQTKAIPRFFPDEWEE